MKKVFSIFAIAAIMVACNNSSDKKKDEPKDSTKTETPVADTTKPVADTTKPVADTTRPM